MIIENVYITSPGDESVGIFDQHIEITGLCIDPYEWVGLDVKEPVGKEDEKVAVETLRRTIKKFFDETLLDPPCYVEFDFELEERSDNE